jgi:glycosyltransferase involved in cell wall biosynthesis/spore maturation protein CgeB
VSSDWRVDDRTIVGRSLGQTLIDAAVEVARLEEQVEKARHAERIRDASRFGRAAAVVRSARHSRGEALRAPSRLARVLLKPGQRVAPWTPQQAVTTPQIGLIPLQRPEPDANETESSVAIRGATLAKALWGGRRLVVAGILADGTRAGLAPECELVDLHPDGWMEALSQTACDLLLIEPLRRKAGRVEHRNLTTMIPVLTEVIEWCHDHGIPTALWNTSDPFDRHLNREVARMVDHVFTADLDSVAYYAKLLGHRRVHICPLATQPALHNPIERGERKRAAVFAGGYQLRARTRSSNLDALIDGTSRVLPVEIYDRNLGTIDDDARWPAPYDERVVGTLPVTQLDVAYKRYALGLNVTTAKTSSTALSQRVLDLLASGTPTVSGFARGIRVLLGDLVPMSDSADRVEAIVSELLADRDATDKRRAMALHRVLSEHTYRRRLDYIAHVVAGISSSLGHRIGVVAVVADRTEARRVSDMVAGQKDAQPELLLVTDHATIADAADRVVTRAKANALTLAEAFPDADAIAVLSPDSWYGPYYLAGLVDALDYGGAPAAAKGTRYRTDGQNLAVIDAGAEYTCVSGELVPWCRALLSTAACRSVLVADAVVQGALIPVNDHVPTIDRFDYCEGVGAGAVPKGLSADLGIDTGLPMDSLVTEAERLADAVLSTPPLTEVDAATYPSGWFQHASGGRAVLASCREGHLFGFSGDEEVAWYIPFRGTLPVADVSQDGKALYLSFDADVRGRGNVGVNVSWVAADGTRIPGNTLFGRGTVHKISVPREAASVRLFFTVKGEGVAVVRSIVLSAINPQPEFVPHLFGRTTKTLLLTDHYSSYELPYQRSFVHSRVKSYARYGESVDVWVNSSDRHITYREYENVDVMGGRPAALRAVLDSGAYTTVLVHTMYEHLWAILKDYVDNLRVVAWMHGGELHRWWLDPVNPSINAPRELQIEQIKADPRFAHWRAVLADPHPKLRFVVVSQTFLDQMQEDLALFDVGFPPEQTVVIHNPVSPERFPYFPKPASQRKRLMSLRPFWSANYANDLTVAAIVDLSTEPWFSELDILVAGYGPAFDEITAPLRDFPNVILKKGFFETQLEIAALYREYGVLLVPTRRDTQGLSRDEGMCAGLVPITTAIDAVPEFLSEEEGYLVPPEDPKAIANAVRDLYHHPDVFLGKSAAAAARIRRTVVDDIVIPQEIAQFVDPADRGETQNQRQTPSPNTRI